MIHISCRQKGLHWARHSHQYICNSCTWISRKKHSIEKLKTFSILKHTSKTFQTLLRWFQKAESLDRSKFLNTKDTTEGTNIIPFVTTFNPPNLEIYTNIIQLKSILHRDEELHQCFRNETFLKSKIQPPNLKRLLTTAKFTVKQTEECSVKMCNHATQSAYQTWSFKKNIFKWSYCWLFW